MSKPAFYLGKEYRPVDFTHDLTRGQRSYLREQGISEEQFRRMDAVSQREWQDETREGAYEHVRRIK